MAQLVESPTEKPGATLTRVRVPGAARDFSSQSQLSVQTLTVSGQPSCATTRIHQHLCACYKSQTVAAVPLFGHR